MKFSIAVYTKYFKLTLIFFTHLFALHSWWWRHKLQFFLFCCGKFIVFWGSGFLLFSISIKHSQSSV